MDYLFEDIVITGKIAAILALELLSDGKPHTHLGQAVVALHLSRGGLASTRSLNSLETDMFRFLKKKCPQIIHISFATYKMISIETASSLQVKNNSKKEDRKTISDAIKFRVLRKHNFRCSYCGISASEAKLEIDHIISLATNGKNVESNYTTACRPCNQSKGTQIMESRNGIVA